ncbi:MAG: hypothetical protein ACOYNY_43285 [Caldilineaceae bacterium]
MSTRISGEVAHVTVATPQSLVAQSTFDERTNGLRVVVGLRAGAGGGQFGLMGKLQNLFQGTAETPTTATTSSSALSV